MIIFGTRGVKSTKATGTFCCPQCATDKQYRHRSVRRFFTLYFIPLIPLDQLGEYVECLSCKGTFVPRVLDYKNDSGKDNFMSNYEMAIKHTMVLMMLADGEVDKEELKIVLQIINKFSHNDMTMEELVTYTDEAQGNPEHLSTYLAKVTPSLNEHGKEIIIKCAVAVASADGHIDKSELELIGEMGEVMEMSTSHLKGILTEMAKPSTAFSEN